MTYKSIKGTLRARISEHLQEQAGEDLDGIQIAQTFDGEELESDHIRIVTPLAQAQKTGSNKLSRWEVTVTVGVSTQIDDHTAEYHDNIVGLIEAYCLQDGLGSLLSNSDIHIDVVSLGTASEVAMESMRHSLQEINIECYLKG